MSQRFGMHSVVRYSCYKVEIISRLKDYPACRVEWRCHCQKQSFKELSFLWPYSLLNLSIVYPYVCMCIVEDFDNPIILECD